MANTAVKENKKSLSPRKILAGDLQRAEFARAHFRVIVKELDTTLEEVLAPEYWVNTGAILQGNGQHPFPIVELIWADGSRYVEVMVLAARNLWAKVKVIRDVNLAEDQAAVEKEEREIAAAMVSSSGLEVKFINQHTKFCVVRTSDGERMAEGLATKQEAEEWIKNYEKAS